MCACVFAHARMCWGKAVISLGALQLLQCRHESSLALDIFRLEMLWAWQMVLYFFPLGEIAGHWKGIKFVATSPAQSNFIVQLKPKNGDLSHRINYLCDMTISNRLLKHHIGTIVGYFKMLGDIQIFHIWLCNS